jgi:hypothetical protein
MRYGQILRVEAFALGVLTTVTHLTRKRLIKRQASEDFTDGLFGRPFRVRNR